MIKLKEIIQQLDSHSFDKMIGQFSNTKAKNYLYLLNSYRSKDVNDLQIMEKLDINNNAFYVLKSRLFDKIQETITEEVNINKSEIFEQLSELSQLYANSTREIAEAKLIKLEKDLLKLEMHYELVLVYSYLKRIHTYSEKYFHYSQLYNKQVANTLSNEKALDLLGEFNRKLCQYVFSRSDQFLQELMFLRKEIDNYNLLSPSKQIELIKNIIEIQLKVICKDDLNDLDTEKTLERSLKIISDMPITSSIRSWELPLQYLFFEFYLYTNQPLKAEEKFKYLENNINSILLNTPISLTACYLTSKIKYLNEKKLTDNLKNENTALILYDKSDIFTKIKVSIYRAVQLYFGKQYKESISVLNNVLNENSFKDYLQINIEIKLFISFIYIRLNDFEISENITKNIARKIKSENNDNYEHVLNLCKAFNLFCTGKNNHNKILDNLTIFTAKNKGKYEILSYFIHEINSFFTLKVK